MAERLNAAVSKTVTSVIPASGVRIPPSPLLGGGAPLFIGPFGILCFGAYDARLWSDVVSG